jgi:mono/diheme cytochrome c family protein
MTLTRHAPEKLVLRARWILPLALALVFLLAGCAEAGQMVDQPRLDPLEPSTIFADGLSARPVVPGTVPYNPEGNPDNPALTGLDADGEPVADLPVEVTQELVAKGKERYNIYCVPCHGPAGEGNGKAVTFGFPKPPALVGGDELTNGQIFQIIKNGQGTMFPYGYRVKPAERWAVIAYIRALQLRGGEVNPAELTPEELSGLGAQR